MNRPFQPSCISPKLHVRDGFTVHHDCRRQERPSRGWCWWGGGKAFWLMLSSRNGRLGSTHLPLSPFLCLKGTIYEKMHHLYFLKAPTSGAQQNLFFSLHRLAVPIYLPTVFGWARLKPKATGVGGGGEGKKKMDRASESREEVDIQRETPHPPARPVNLTDVLRTHCSIACKIDTLAYL